MAEEKLRTKDDLPEDAKKMVEGAPAGLPYSVDRTTGEPREGGVVGAPEEGAAAAQPAEAASGEGKKAKDEEEDDEKKSGAKKQSSGRR